MSDKYVQAVDFIIGRVIELYRTPYVALNWEKIVASEISNFLREAFPEPTPAPEGQRWELERKIANAVIAYLWPDEADDGLQPSPDGVRAAIRQAMLTAYPTPEPRKEPVRIVASAIQLDGVTYTGLRHHQIIGYLADAGFPTPIAGEQGFIDNTGRFLSRKEAATLALKSGQVTKLIAPGMGLDSADVFPRKAPTEPEDAQGEARLKPCPFCGGEAERIDVPEDETEPNAGGSYIYCPRCLASSRIIYGDKSGLVESWNNRQVLARGDEYAESVYQADQLADENKALCAQLAGERERAANAEARAEQSENDNQHLIERLDAAELALAASKDEARGLIHLADHLMCPAYELGEFDKAGFAEWKAKARTYLDHKEAT